MSYLLLWREDVGQREHDLREVFDGLRRIVRRVGHGVDAGRPAAPDGVAQNCSDAKHRWNSYGGGCVYWQTQGWLAAGCFEMMVGDHRVVPRLAAWC